MSRRSHSQHAPPEAPSDPQASQPLGDYLRDLADDANATLGRLRRDAVHLAEIKARAAHAMTAVGDAVKVGLEEEFDHFAERIKARIGRAR